MILDEAVVKLPVIWTHTVLKALVCMIHYLFAELGVCPTAANKQLCDLGRNSLFLGFPGDSAAKNLPAKSLYFFLGRKFLFSSDSAKALSPFKR